MGSKDKLGNLVADVGSRKERNQTNVAFSQNKFGSKTGHFALADYFCIFGIGFVHGRVLHREFGVGIGSIRKYKTPMQVLVDTG